MYATFTLTGRHTTPSGRPHKGQVIVAPNTVIRDTAGDIVMSGQETATLDETGAWSIVLPCDDPSLNPSTGIGYRVGYALHSTPMAAQSFYATAGMAGTTLDVSDIVTVLVPAPLSAIVGPQGEPGPAGADGVDGADGAPGPKGDKGDPGDTAFKFDTDGTPYYGAAATSNTRVVTESAARNTFAVPDGVRWVALGDSLTSVAGGGAPYMGWVTQAEILASGKIVALYNAGVPGNDASQARSRVATDVLPYKPTIVTLWVGTNDISNGRAFADYKADITATVAAIKAAGATVALFTIPPRADTTKLGTIGQWNAWLKWYARDSSLHLIDAHAVLVDPATGTYRAGFDSGDGIHMTQAAHNAVAQEFTNLLLPRVVAAKPISPATNVDPNNLLTNGLLLSGTDASPTGWFPQGGALTGFVEGRVTDADFAGGKAWQVAATNPGSFRQFTGNASTAWSPGDELLFTCRVKVVSSSGVPASSGLNVNCNFFGSSGINPAAQYISLAGLSGRVSKRLVVPAGTSTVQLDTVFNPTSAGVITWRVGEFGIYNLTRLGVA